MNTIASRDPMKDRASYSVSDVVALTGLSSSTVYRQMRSGQLKTVKIGSRTIITVADFNAWLSGQRSA